MKNNQRTQRLLVLLAVCGGMCAPNLAQPPAGPTLYQITEGTYRMVGGFWGELRQGLPNPDQTYVTLDLEAPGGGAELSFLKEDLTVYRTLTKGVVTGSVVRFSYPMDFSIYPDLVQPALVDYVVTNLNRQLAIQGAIRVIDPPCCDIPYYFAHTNVVAVAFPELTARVSEIELCWDTTAKASYQLQSCTDLAANRWANVGPPVTGTGAKLCVTDKVIAGQPQKYYRIVPVGQLAAADFP